MKRTTKSSSDAGLNTPTKARQPSVGSSKEENLTKESTDAEQMSPVISLPPPLIENPAAASRLKAAQLKSKASFTSPTRAVDSSQANSQSGKTESNSKKSKMNATKSTMKRFLAASTTSRPKVRSPLLRTIVFSQSACCGNRMHSEIM